MECITISTKIIKHLFLIEFSFWFVAGYRIEGVRQTEIIALSKNKQSEQPTIKRSTPKPKPQTKTKCELFDNVA